MAGVARGPGAESQTEGRGGKERTKNVAQEGSEDQGGNKIVFKSSKPEEKGL